MPTLNRFPLLGLWAREAARRVGYRADEAAALGHAYAVLYAIRKARVPHPTEAGTEKPARKTRPAPEQITFGGDDLDIVRDAQGHIQGRIGGDRPQTQRTYQSTVQAKFPPGYYERVEKAFRELLRHIPPRQLDSRKIYNLYDEWKKRCAVGSRVDLDQLIGWCRDAAARLSRS